MSDIDLADLKPGCGKKLAFALLVVVCLTIGAIFA